MISISFIYSIACCVSCYSDSIDEVVKDDLGYLINYSHYLSSDQDCDYCAQAE